MTQEDVLTIIRLARKYPQASDALLEGAERISSNGAASEILDFRPKSEAETGVSFPLEVFHIYKGKRYSGRLSRERTVVVDGVTYYSPSAAAMSITNNNVNGKQWWLYQPASGSPRQIDDLYRRGLL